MAEAIRKQNTFSRTLSNEAKLGAYYTDVGMCRRIKNLLRFPTDKPVCCLEPSIGDGKAILTVLGKENGLAENCKVFGVELNKDTFDGCLKENPLIDYKINADFLLGVKISHTAFSFTFANPPYGEDERGTRYETRFVEKMYSYLKTNAVMALVIPEYVFRDIKFQKAYLARFRHEGAWKFDEAVYAQFKQICVIGRKKPNLGFKAEQLEEFRNSIPDSLPYLPLEPVDEPIVVGLSNDELVEYFTTIEFNAEEAHKLLRKSALNSKVIGGRLTVTVWSSVELGQPIVPLSPDMCYLVSSAGGGQGFAGSAEDYTLHLQRGKAEVVKKKNIDYDDDGNPICEKEVSSTRITQKIIEYDGTIRVLS